jgi:SAM-dependent methyltransferase
MSQNAGPEPKGHDLDRLHRSTWARPDTVQELARHQGWIDPGEWTSLLRVVADVRGRAILDVGVGAGRTSTFLRLVSDDYVAIDYTPEMVELCRALHPGVDVRLGDARDLSMFEDNRFALVLFSFNGIDALGHADRARALAEFYRVLAPGGWLIFSTHNKDGPALREAPWRRADRQRPTVRRMARFVALLPANASHYARGYRNWWRNRPLLEEHDGWAMGRLSAHDWALVIHYTTLDGQVAALGEIGFTDVEMYERERGTLVTSGDDRRETRWWYVVARRPST